MSGTDFTYRGEDRRGAYGTGRLAGTTELWSWVRGRYRQGWRVLSVLLDGREVAAISNHPFHGRSWWAEADPHGEEAEEGSPAGSAVRSQPRPGFGGKPE